ncbi:MAG: amidase domain-containing protein [Ruminiclostridium sp.]
MRSGKFALTALIVVVLAAIYVVGFFLLWDYFGVDNTITHILDHDLYASEEKPVSKTTVSLSFSGSSLTEEEQALLSGFFTYYYAGLGNLAPEKIEKFFAFQSDDQLFDEMALDYEIFLAESLTSPFVFDGCTIYINVESRKESRKSATTDLSLTLSAEFSEGGEALPQKIKKERHLFTISTKENDALISAHTTDRAARAAAEKQLDREIEKAGYGRSDLAYTYFPPYIKAALTALKEDTTALYAAFPEETESMDSPVPEYRYDREKAASFAENAGNGDTLFGSYPEDDANFTSQCLFASGIPMDCQGEGDTQWKWYDSEVNTQRKKTGCSESWYLRDKFYDYALKNTGFGLCAGELPRACGKKGDIIQISEQGEPVLQCIITDTVKDSEGKVADYIVCTDRYTCVSLKTLGCRDFRIIGIFGYNTANI